MYKEKKIAVCFSGQLRTWKKVFNTWKYIVDDNIFDFEIDYFFHLFKENTIPKVGINQVDLDLIDVDDYEVQELINIFKPKKYKIESQQSFVNTLDRSKYLNPYICQYYSMLQSAELKHQYEIENNFKYDICVKSRYDLNFKHFIINPEDDIRSNCYYGYNPILDDNYEVKIITDLFFYSDSQTFDFVSSYYKEMDSLPENLKNYKIEPEYNWFYFLKKNGIFIKPHHWNIKVMRNNINEIKNKDMSYETI